MGFAEQIRLALEPAGEFLEVVFIDCLEKLGHDDRLPWADNRLPWASVRLRMFDQVVDEAPSATPFLHAQPERGVELDTTVENESSHCPMVEQAGTEESLRHRAGAVVVRRPVRLRGGPLHALALPAEQRRAKIQPAGETVFPSEPKLGVSQRDRKVRSR